MPIPLLPEKLLADPNFSMLCGILAKACILGKFHPQPSSLGKYSFIRLMRMIRAFKDCLTCDLGCGSLTQHSNGMVQANVGHKVMPLTFS
jgi:hypothetical protein